jgi:hypothetical protein
LEERVRQAVEQKAQEAKQFAAANTDTAATGVCSPGNPQGLTESQLKAEMMAQLGRPASIAERLVALPVNNTNQGKIGDGLELTYRQFIDKPILSMGANLEKKMGVDWGTQSKLDDSSNKIDALLNKSYGEKTPGSISYSSAMRMPVSPLDIKKYDTTNITYHDYRLDVELCHKQESFCTVPNLSPLVDYRSAPIQSWSEGMQNGRQILLGNSPIIHSSDYDQGKFVNRTLSDHPFHSGSVESNLYWKGDVLHLKTVGYGYGASPLHTAANYGVGVTYFGLWQTAVKYNVDVIRQSQATKP